MKRRTSPTPNGTALRLDEVEYLKLQNLILKADSILADGQARLNTAIAARDVYLKDVAAKHQIALPSPIATIAWNDETQEFSFT